MRRSNHRLDAPSDPAYERGMNTEQIRKRLQGQGPHLLRTSDGREYLIPHPEFVFVGRHNVVIEDEAGMLEVIDPMHVVSIRSGTSRKPRNGGRNQ
jgi:hypothetical protein